MRYFLWILLLILGGSHGFAFSTVVIDAGHGGHDRGGIPGQRVSEKVMALDVAMRVNRILARRYRTVMTRRNDQFISLGQRVAIGNAQRDALFLSIHFNSAPREGARGFETFYYSPNSARVAQRIQTRIMRAWPTENRGVKRRGFFVIRRSRHPAVLVECGFLTNRAEARVVLKSDNRQRLANEIAQAVMSMR